MQGANTKIKMAKHKNKKWKIKTWMKHSRSGNDYQNDDQNDKFINTGWSVDD